MDFVGLFVYIVVAAFVGGLASFLLNDRSGLLFNIIAAALGSWLMDRFVSPILGIGSINTGGLSAASIIMSLVGALLVILIVKIIRKLLH